MKNRVSKNYVCTLDPLSTSDMTELQAIKDSVRIINKIGDTKYRVCLRGRKPAYKIIRHNHALNKTRVLSYEYGGGIVGGLANATRYDVYIYERR